MFLQQTNKIKNKMFTHLAQVLLQVGAGLATEGLVLYRQLGALCQWQCCFCPHYDLIKHILKLRLFWRRKQINI